MGSSVAESSSSPNFKWDYDVFLSFRGEDTRSNFTSHLDMALRQKGVNVFIDDKLDRGEQIPESLFKSIEQALISIVIFSENYASSTWCLDELVKIIECKKSKGQIVWPVFYKVDPSDVRKQTGSFGEALAKHQSKFMMKIQTWREALTAAANLPGWDLGTGFEKALAKHQAKFMMKIQTWREALTAAANLSGWNLGTGKEAGFIHNLVREVSSRLNRKPLYVAKYPVGIDSQLEVMNLHSHKTHGVNMVGIYGIGGIGKTTLAKALYNKIANQFEGSSFLSNVREASQQFNGLVQLQEKLLYEILMDDLKVGNLDRGINIIRERLCSKKVLILLDDVDKPKQLEALVGGHDWFGRGSKIIVTTRDNHLLSSHGFDEMHGIQGLDHDKALELFSWHAFKKSHPSSNYLDISERAVGYCKGLPLALVVLGSFLCTRDQSKWKSILDEFENSLSKDIQDILRISFDGLEDRVKDVFLDISCFFLGKDINYIKNLLEACDLNPEFGITVLMDLSLITVENTAMQMHDLIRQMGQTFIRGESSEPGKRSRLWVEEDVMDVLTENSGTSAVKAIKLDLPIPTELEIDAQAFRNMKNLRLLIIHNARFSTNLESLPNNLKWIEWRGFSVSSFPPCFIMKKLVGLDLQHSFIRHLGKKFQNCERLKHIDISHSTLLEEIPDLSAASNLEKLYLKECTNLRMIHESIGSLDKLVTLDLEQCSNLEKLPNYLTSKSLEDLNLSYCKKLEEIPEFSTASNLKRLYVKECTNLRMIHESVGSLDKLIILDLQQCSNLKKLPSYLMLKSLVRLNLAGCRKLELFSEIAENMKSLRFMHLEFTAIQDLPLSIGYLTTLKVLSLDSCTNLIALPSTIYLLESLEELRLGGCSRFENFPDKWEPTSKKACSSSKIMDTSSSSEFSHLQVPKRSFCSKLTLLDLRCCNISNVDFLETLSNVSTSLTDLYLSENKFSSLPSCLHKFMSLTNLQLRNCKFLQEIPNLPQCIQNLDASGCESLARSPDNIVDIISRKQDFNLGDFPREFILMNSEIPEWFSYQTTANLMRVGFRHYPDMEKTLAACVIFKVNGDSYKEVASISCNIVIGNRLRSSFMRQFPSSTSEYMWLVTTSLAFGSLEVKDWNHVLVWFEVVKFSEVIATIRSCGVHLTDEFYGIQTDVKWPVVNYTDFHQLEKLPSLDIEANLVKRFAQEVSAKLNCNAMLHVANYPVGIDSKIQHMNFPLHVTSHGATMISGMEGMGETTLAKSLCNKFEKIDDAFWREALNHSSGFVSVNEDAVCGSLMPRSIVGDNERGINIPKDRLCSKKYLIIFYDVDSHEEIPTLVHRQYDSFWVGGGTTHYERNRCLLYIHGFHIIPKSRDYIWTKL